MTVRAVLFALAGIVAVLVGCVSEQDYAYRSFCAKVPREAYRGSAILVGSGFHACLVEYPERLTIQQVTCKEYNRAPDVCAWDGPATVFVAPAEAGGECK